MTKPKPGRTRRVGSTVAPRWTSVCPAAVIMALEGLTDGLSGAAVARDGQLAADAEEGGEEARPDEASDVAKGLVLQPDRAGEIGASEVRKQLFVTVREHHPVPAHVRRDWNAPTSLP